MQDIDRFFVAPEDTVRDAMQRIDRGTKGIALVVDAARRLVGTLTDGDCRRAILDGTRLNETVAQLLDRKPASRRQPVSISTGASHESIVQLMHQRNLRQMPLVDEQGRVVDMITLEDLVPAQELPVRAVIMAGGFGSRLRPLTDDTPKPMLPIDGKPLMERTIDQLRQAGVHHVNVTTHYLHEKITRHFGDGSDFGVALQYVSEDRPLGTAGALRLVDDHVDPLLVINGDILTSVDFRAMVAFHRQQAADLTIAVRHYEIQVPYGVVKCDGPRVQDLEEKPQLGLFVNAGMYLLQPSARQFIPAGERFDMTDLIRRLLEEGRHVASFPVVEYWLDIGRHDDFRQAQEDMKDRRAA